MFHQHPHGKTDLIGLTGINPFPDMNRQFLPVFLKYLGRHLVTGCPVVHIGQKVADLFHTAVKVFYPGDDKGMKLVFIKISVG